MSSSMDETALPSSATFLRDAERQKMERLVAALPESVRTCLAGGVDVLDWGCALGDGAHALAQTFPCCRVTGLDASARAIGKAHKRYPDLEFIHVAQETLPRPFDVVITSNRLEHFDDPLDVMRGLLSACRQLFIALVPYREEPLSEHHASRFDERSFPLDAGGFRLIHSAVIDVDEGLWPGQQLLVVYASPAFRQPGRAENTEAERRKWDAYYAGPPVPLIPQAMQAFCDQLAGEIARLLPAGSRILEGGSGEGWQSLALARLGKFDVTLMDFSREALRRARELFRREGVAASFRQGDVLKPGTPDYDLVFNAGVLEHYTFEEQVAFLRGMASRSRKFVLVLVPNAQCYWYWIWRMRVSSRNEWPYGKEVPLADLSGVFSAAGIRLVGHALMGESWTEVFLDELSELDPTLRQQIRQIHRSPMLSQAVRSYLVAALGVVTDETPAVPDVWQPATLNGEHGRSELCAALADALAMQMGAKRELEQLRRAQEQTGGELQRVRRDLDERARESESLRTQTTTLSQSRAALDARLGEADAVIEQQRVQLEQSAERRQQLEQAQDELIQQHNVQLEQAAERRQELEQALGERDELIRQRDDQLAESEHAQRDLRSQLEQGQRRDLEAQTQIAEFEQAVTRLRRDSVARQAELDGQRVELETLRKDIEERQKQLEAQRTHAAMLQAGITDIASSMGWALLVRLTRLRRFLAPEGSRRHRALRRAFGGLKAIKRRWLAARRKAGRAWVRLGLPFRMTWHANAFDRFKRQRQAGFPRALNSLRCPGQAGLVSVVLPVYNGEDYIREALDSVLAQTYADFELIVVDDGSQDTTPQILSEYAAREPRMRVMRQANQKLPRALSNGFRAARGEFLAWTSADNRLKANFLEKMVACLRRHPSWDVSYANEDIIGPDGRPLRNSAWFSGYQEPPGSEHVYRPLDPSELNTWPNNFVGAAFLYRRRVPYLIGEYSPRLFGLEDYDYWMRANALLSLRHSDFDQPVADYRFHDASLTANDEQLGITRNRVRLMAFEDFRRNFYLGGMIWLLDESDPAAALAARLDAKIRQVGHVRLSHDDPGLVQLPRLWLPITYVRITRCAADEPDPPNDLPPAALKVLVQVGDAPLPKTVNSAWDMCVAMSPAQQPLELPRPWQGWLVTPDVATLFVVLDIRSRAMHLDRIEAEIASPRPCTCEVSVIVCAYRRTGHVQRAIASVACQDVDPRSYEVIVVNNDRSDPSVGEAVERLRRDHFATRPERLRLVDCPITGLSYARNAGMAEANGEYLFFLDDDALACEDWLAALRRAFREHENAGVIGGHIELKVPHSSPPWLRPDWYRYWSHFSPQFSEDTELQHWWEFPWGANWAARRRALMDTGGFRTRYGRSGNDFGGGEELTVACLVRSLGYEVRFAPGSKVIHDVEPNRFTMQHVRRTIRAGVHVAYQTQLDLIVPMETRFRVTFRRMCSNYARALGPRLPRGGRRRRLAYASAYRSLLLRQCAEWFRRFRRPAAMSS